MLKSKRLLTEDEMSEYIKIKESKGDKQAQKYLQSLDIFEEVENK